MTARLRPALNLPPLRALLPDFAKLERTPTRSHALLALLRPLANSLRGDQPCRFYSTREVAAFVGVDHKLVARVYAELEREGVLVSRRSSMTMLRARQPQPLSALRGVVGLPVWNYGYSLLSDWREFCVRIEDELRRHHWVADFIFFGESEFNQPSFVDRLLSHELDYLLWFLPTADAIPCLERVGDQGVRTVTVSDGSQRFPGAAYVLDDTPAWRQCLQDWKRDGVRSVRLLPGGYDTSDYETSLRAQGFVVRRDLVGLDDFARYVSRLRADAHEAVILFSPQNGATLAQRRPEALVSLLRKRRVLLRQRIELPASYVRGCHFDLLHTDPSTLARRLADAITAGHSRAAADPVVVPAEYRGRVAAETYAQYF